MLWTCRHIRHKPLYILPFVRPAREALGRFCRGALRPDEIPVDQPWRRGGQRRGLAAGPEIARSDAQGQGPEHREHDRGPALSTAASRLILASLAPSSTCQFVESNLRGVRCAAPDRASGHQVAQFTRDCGGFLEGYRILTKTWSGARPGSRAVVVTGLELNETLETRNPPGGGLV